MPQKIWKYPINTQDVDFVLEIPEGAKPLYFEVQRGVPTLWVLVNPKHKFEKRKSHLRPRPSPISLHPKLARALVNLTGAEENEIITDPFCGSGGILIEAGLMGMKTIGYDINKKMIWKSMVNLKHYKIKNCKLEVKDFFKINKKYKYIVSDLPYGLNTNIMQNIRVTKSNRNKMKKYLEEFYSKIIKKLEKIRIKKVVIIFIA